jgi:hypothetical protein
LENIGHINPINYVYIVLDMPLLEPSFTIPSNIPIIGGEWGPFINPNIRSDEKKQLFMLFIGSLVLILIFGSIAYYSNKAEFEDPPRSEDIEKIEIPDHFTLKYFLGLDKLVDFNSLMVGMGAGIVFGLIDNGGLWFGMDSLDPVFESKSVPWIYGYGGRRPFSGLENEVDSVYYGVKFKDGMLERGDKIGIRTPHEICKKIQNDYDKASHKINNYDKKWIEKYKMRENVKTNEAAFADPNSPMFLGHNMSKKDFFTYFAQYKINESTYNERIDNYRDYLNNKNIPENVTKANRLGVLTRDQKTQKLRYKRDLANLQKLKLKNIGFPTQKYKDQVKMLKYKISQRQVWPGRSKKLAQSWMGGWNPGKLTQAGIGNTYSDFLGAFLATFAGILIINMSKISNVSILSEVIGIVLGCILGIFIPRLISPKS